MAERGPRRNRFSALIAGSLAVALFAGAAAANPAAFDRTVKRAATMLFGPQEEEARQGRSAHGDGRSSPTPHESDACSEIVEAFQRASPPSGDVHRIGQAIDVVQANCEGNPQAGGLLTALRRLVANAEKHAEHESNAGGQGKGAGRSGARGHGGSATDHGSGGGHGKGGGHGNGEDHGNGGGSGAGPGNGGGSSHGH